jgi:hypothetical protein
MNLRVEPRYNPAEYIAMSRIAEQAFLQGLCSRLEWARDNPRAILLYQVQPQVEGMFDSKFYIVTEAG